MTTHNILTCLFGHHQYSDKLTEDNRGRHIYLCKICKKSGYREWDNGTGAWADYDNDGNCIHENIVTDLKFGIIKKELVCAKNGIMEMKFGLSREGEGIGCMKSGMMELDAGLIMDFGCVQNQRIGNMKKKYNKLTCLFGYHDYDEEPTKDNCGNPIHLCKHCKRSGYWNFGDGRGSRWTDLDVEGKPIYDKWSDGVEVWYTGKCWTNKKPKNWKYEKCITN